MTLCQDAFASWPDSIVGRAGGASCTRPVPGPGWQCPDHASLTHQLMDTTITDIPDEREAKARREEQDPATRALIAEATSYLKACEARLKVQDDFTLEPVHEFVAGILHDPKYGTKWFRVSPKLAEALLKFKHNEEARAAKAQAQASSQPRLPEVIKWLEDNAPRSTFAASLIDARRRWGSLTQGQYDAVVRGLDRSRIEQNPSQESPSGDPGSSPASQDGWYKVGDDIYKVQRAVHGSGHLYAKKLVITGPGEGSWEYAPGMVRQLTSDQRLSLEDAQAFGKLYGVCAICGKTLTDETSIADGIGPVCNKRIQGG